MKKLFFILLFVNLATRVFAQQDPMYSQYVFNGLLINPAYAGTREILNATALYRNQWVNIPGAPKTGVFSLDSPVKNQKIGLGLNLIVDKIGVISHTGIAGVYSYKIYMDQSVVSFGMQAGIGFYNSNNSIVKYTDNASTDPAFMQDYHMILPNFSVGVYYHSDRFFAGVSIMDLLGRAVQDKFYPNFKNDQTINIVNHFFGNAGYLIDLSPEIKFQPSTLLKYVSGAPLEVDFNGVISFYDLLHFGLSYRSYASIDLLTQVKVSNKLSIGYSYEYSTNELSNFTTGSHEIVLRYQLDFSKDKVLTPRFF